MAGESDSGAKVDCVIADDDQFCRCVVDNAGDASQVCRYEHDSDDSPVHVAVTCTCHAGHCV